MTDEQIGRLLAAIQKRSPRTVIVFAADHGESLQALRLEGHVRKWLAAAASGQQDIRAKRSGS